MLWDDQWFSSEGAGVDGVTGAESHSVGTACGVVITISGDSALPACDALSLGVQFPVFQRTAWAWCWLLWPFERAATTYPTTQHRSHQQLSVAALFSNGFLINIVKHTTCLGSKVASSDININLLKPTGHVMHHRFNIQQLYALSTLYLCVLYLSENKQRLVPLTA